LQNCRIAELQEVMGNGRVNPLGDDVHRFDTFAPRFNDRFHVGGFSRLRRGARDVTRGRAVEFHDTDHFFFADPEKTDTVVAETRSFLSQP